MKTLIINTPHGPLVPLSLSELIRIGLNRPTGRRLLIERASEKGLVLVIHKPVRAISTPLS